MNVEKTKFARSSLWNGYVVYGLPLKEGKKGRGALEMEERGEKGMGRFVEFRYNMWYIKVWTEGRQLYLKIMKKYIKWNRVCRIRRRGCVGCVSMREKIGCMC